MWLPRFACPECGADAADDRAGHIACSACGRLFEQRSGFVRFLGPARLAQIEPFLRQYCTVRARDGYRVSAPEFYRVLPYVPPDHPHAEQWRLRREGYQHLHHRVLGAHPGPVRVLDLGAGNGWLSHRLASFGHEVVAVDWLDDAADGLGACCHYTVPVLAVQADFDALPFAPGQFDLVVFNGALHYSPDVAVTLAHARRMLAPGGSLVVMDSPLFRRDRDGRAMVADEGRRFEKEYGLAEVISPGAGFLTFAQLSRAAEALGLGERFFPSRGRLGWRVRRSLARIRLRRAPAGFGVWVAR